MFIRYLFILLAVFSNLSFISAEEIKTDDLFMADYIREIILSAGFTEASLFVKSAALEDSAGTDSLILILHRDRTIFSAGEREKLLRLLFSNLFSSPMLDDSVKQQRYKNNEHAVRTVLEDYDQLTDPYLKGELLLLSLYMDPEDAVSLFIMQVSLLQKRLSETKGFLPGREIIEGILSLNAIEEYLLLDHSQEDDLNSPISEGIDLLLDLIGELYGQSRDEIFTMKCRSVLEAGGRKRPASR